MSKNKVVLKLGENRLIRFSFDDFEGELDTDKLIKIDYENLVAELLTFPVVVNKLGLLAADADSQFRLAKLNLRISEAKLRRQVRVELTEEVVDAKNNVKTVKPTVQEVEDGIMLKKTYRLRSEEMNEAEKNKEYLYSIYDAAKDKSRKLDKLSLTLQPGDIDESLIQRQMNRIYFKIKKVKE
jgi:hypothetical protein